MSDIRVIMNTFDEPKTVTIDEAVAAMRRGWSVCVLGTTPDEGWQLSGDLQRAANKALVDTYGLLSFSVSRVPVIVTCRMCGRDMERRDGKPDLCSSECIRAKYL